MWGEAQGKLTEVASEHNMPSPQVNFSHRSFPPRVVDDRIPTKEKYYPISYLPLNMATPEWKKKPRGAMKLPVKHAKFFICKQNVPCTIECTMIFKEVIDKIYHVKTPQEHTLTKHCVENKHYLFYFTRD